MVGTKEAEDKTSQGCRGPEGSVPQNPPKKRAEDGLLLKAGDSNLETQPALPLGLW